MAKVILSVENVTKNFSDRIAVNNVSFKICEGEIWQNLSLNKMISMENLGGLVSSVSHQLFQQKAVGMIPGLLGNPNNPEHVKLGQKMALAYMAGTSAKENYSLFRSAGANEETAGLAMLASTFALYGLMNSEYLGYKDTLFKGSWLDESVTKAPAMNFAKEWSEKYAKEGAEEIVENATENSAKKKKTELTELLLF